MQNTLKQVDKTTLKLNGITYKGYTLSELPPSFAFIYNEIISRKLRSENYY